MSENKARKIVKNNGIAIFNANTTIKRNHLLNVYVVRYHANNYVAHFTNFREAYNFAREESLNTYVQL